MHYNWYLYILTKIHIVRYIYKPTNTNFLFMEKKANKNVAFLTDEVAKYTSPDIEIFDVEIQQSLLQTGSNPDLPDTPLWFLNYKTN